MFLQVDRLHAIPTPLKPSWDRRFLDLLYTVITTKKVRQQGLRYSRCSRGE
jgi:hypothetical protein